MKIHGKSYDGPSEVVIVMPHGDEDIIFKAKAVLNFEDFDKIVPIPKPPEIIKRGQGVISNFNDPGYKAAIVARGEQKLSWIMFQSLSATEGLEWDNVDPDNPSTWIN